MLLSTYLVHSAPVPPTPWRKMITLWWSRPLLLLLAMAAPASLGLGALIVITPLETSFYW